MSSRFRGSLLIVGLVGFVGVALYPIVLAPIINPKKWQAVQKETRKGIDQASIQPGVARFSASIGIAMSPFRTLFLYSGAMLSLPLFMYFFSKYIFDGYFGAKDNNSVFYAAMMSVVTVHIVLAMFLWEAFTESPPPPTLPPAQPSGIKKD